mgnify:FL=1
MRQKYGNKPRAVGAETYRSGREADRHQELLLLQHAGKITGLVREVPFELAPGVRIDGEKRARPPIRYYADFVYTDLATCKIVVEDAKGMRTPVYRLKKHLMKTIHRVDVKET